MLSLHLSVISSLIFCLVIQVVAVGRFCSPKTINTGVPNGSVLLPTLFRFFISELLCCNSCPVLSYAHDSTLHCSIHINCRSTEQEVSELQDDASAYLTCDSALISEWGREDLANFTAIKTSFFHQLARYSLPTNYPFIFDDAWCNFVSCLNVPGVSFSKNLDWKDYCLTKTTTRKLGVLHRFHSLFTPAELPTLDKDLTCPCVAYCSHVSRGSVHTVLLDRVESISDSSIAILTTVWHHCLRSVAL